MLENFIKDDARLYYSVLYIPINFDSSETTREHFTLRFACVCVLLLMVAQSRVSEKQGLFLREHISSGISTALRNCKCCLTADERVEDLQSFMN